MVMRDESTAVSEGVPRTDPTRAPCGTSVPPRGFETWYLEHRGAVYGYVRYRVATVEAAEDVTSDVFLKALRSLHRYDPSRAAPRTWLLRIARNAVTDHLRARRRRGTLHVSLDRIPEPASPLPSPEERVVRRERMERIHTGEGRLRPRDREILSLRYGAGLSNGEIAQHLGITANAVAVRIHRAVARLRRAVLA
jgi:RNA polymerase sigma-70 factor (ECF subfamily)